MSYTKGQWKHTEDGVIIAEDGRQIASVFPRDREANAYLIAAAPDLYEACKEVAKAYKCSPTSMQPLFWLRCVQALAMVKK